MPRLPRAARAASRYLTVRLTDEERALLQYVAALIPCSVSAYVREAVLERMIRDLRAVSDWAQARRVEGMLERVVRDG